MNDIDAMPARRITAIGSGDSHGPRQRLWAPTIHLYGERLDSAPLLNGIAEGRAMITASPGIRADFEANSPSGTIRIRPRSCFAREYLCAVYLNLERFPPGQLIPYSWEQVLTATLDPAWYGHYQD